MGRAREFIGHTLQLTNSVGAASALNLLGRRMFGRSAPVPVTWRGHRLSVRPADSDPFVLAQIFAKHEYDAHPFWMEKLNDVAAQYVRDGRVPLIVDAGANVGYSAVYLAAHFPDAVVVAVEPDAKCVEMLSRNGADNPRIRPLHAALWSHGDGVNLMAPDDESWANRVSGTGDTPSTTLEALIATIPNAAPLILKLDIEGAETEVCRASPDAVASFVSIMIEPHDWMQPGSGGLSPLYDALSGRTMDTLIRDETLMLFDCAVLENASAVQR